MNFLDIGLIGLDFGSSKTVISILRGVAIEIILNDCSMRETHNIVAFTDKETLIGDHAFMKLKSNYKNTVLYPNRILNAALAKDSSLFQKEAEWQPANLKIQNDSEIVFEVNYLGKSKTFTSIQIIAFLLGFYAQKTIKASKFVMSQYGFVISVPTYYTSEERVLLAKSSQICSMNLLKILNESTAVGLIYKKIHDEELSGMINGKRVLFIDVGFSKTGIFLINFLGGNVTIIHELYDRYLGLRDIDNLLLTFYQNIIKKNNPNYQENYKIRLRILEGIEKQRKMLSANNEAPIVVESLFEDYDLSYQMVRQEFESLISSFIEKMKTLFLRFRLEGELFSKNLDFDELEIIGGGIRIPIIQKIIMESFNQNTLAKTLNATECIAMGCALYCNKIAGIPTSPPLGIINETLYYPIYCDVKPKGINEILVFAKGVSYPCVSNVTIPKDDKINEVVFYYKLDDKVYTLYEISLENEFIGVISIQAAINDDGVLLIKDWKINENKGSLNLKKDVLEIVSETVLNEYRSEYEAIIKHDKSVQETYEMKNKMESYIYNKREELLSKYKFFMKPENITLVQNIFQEYEHWLYNHDDSQSKKDYYENKMNEMQAKIEPMLHESFELYEMKNLKDNEITSITQLKNLSIKHKKQPFIDKVSINLNNQKIGDGGGLLGYFKDGMSRVKQFINSLKIQDTLRIDLRNNALSDHSIGHLLEILETQKDLVCLDLQLNNNEDADGKNEFSDKCMFDFCEKLRHLTKIKRIKLALDTIDEINFNVLTISLESLKLLESVEIRITKNDLSLAAQNNFNTIKNVNKSIKSCKLECKIETPVEKTTKYATFLVSMNTASQNIKPFYSQNSITIIKENLKIFAFQTSSTIALLKCENINNWKNFSQIDLKESTQKTQIGNFEFLPPPSENLDSYSKEMLIGYRNGLILHVNYFENTILNKFNQLEIEEGDKYVSVQTILFSPKSSAGFYVLFSNNLLMHYLLEKTGENQEFLEEKSRIVDKKKPSAKNKIKTIALSNSFEVKQYKCEAVPELSFTAGRNLDKIAKNPTCFYYFDCPAISEVVFHQNSHFKKMGSEHIFAFVSHDGFLRIFDLEQKKGLFAFKSSYGGFNSLCFNKYGDMVALSGQDDNIVVLNLSNYGYLTIEGHKSFITKSILKDIDDKYIRVFASSMDGSISITDVNTFEVGLRTSFDGQIADKKKGPTKVFFSDFKSKRVMAKNINFACGEGVGNITFHEPHFLSAGYDGAIAVWCIENENDRNEQEVEENENLKRSRKKESEEEKIPEEKDKKNENEDLPKKKNNYMNKEETKEGLGNSGKKNKRNDERKK